MIDIIHEKDLEIEKQKKILVEKLELLQKISRGTTEVIHQNEVLSQQLQKITLENEIKKEEIEILQNNLIEIKNETTRKINELEDILENNLNDLKEGNETISKLQFKCANLVKEKQEITRKYEIDKENFEQLNENGQVENHSFFSLSHLFLL